MTLKTRNRKISAAPLATLLAGFLLSLGCARVVQQKAPAAAVDLLRLELFYAGRLDPDLHYIVAVNRSGLNSQNLGPKAVVAGVSLAENWTDAFVLHQGVWTYYTGNQIRQNQTGEPFSSNTLTSTLVWNTTTQPYLASFGLLDKVLPRGGGKITLELCKTFFALVATQRSTTSKCAPNSGVTVNDKALSLNFLVSPLHPDRNGSFNVLDNLVEPLDFTIRRDANVTSVNSGSPLPATPDINLLGHNSDYERADTDPADDIPDDMNTTLGVNTTDTDNDLIPDIVETSLETDPGNNSSFPLFQGLKSTLNELWHPADLTYWRLRQVQPGQV